MNKPHLRSVAPSTASLLRQWFKDHRNAKQALSESEAVIAMLGRQLAKERGVAFIRFEHLQQEFGK